MGLTISKVFNAKLYREEKQRMFYSRWTSVALWITNSGNKAIGIDILKADPVGNLHDARRSGAGT